MTYFCLLLVGLLDSFPFPRYYSLHIPENSDRALEVLIIHKKGVRVSTTPCFFFSIKGFSALLGYIKICNNIDRPYPHALCSTQPNLQVPTSIQN